MLSFLCLIFTSPQLTHVHLSQGDYIYIYDGPDNSSDLMLSLTGHSHTKEPVESTGQSLHVRLDSQWDSTQDEGFEMVYYMGKTIYVNHMHLNGLLHG